MNITKRKLLHLQNIWNIFETWPADTRGSGVWLDRKTFWPKYLKPSARTHCQLCNKAFKGFNISKKNSGFWIDFQLFCGSHLLYVRAALVMAFKWEKLLFQLSEKQEIIQVFRQDRTFRFQLGSILTFNAKLARSMFSKQDWTLTWMNELTKTMDKNDLQLSFSCVLYYCPF